MTEPTTHAAPDHETVLRRMYAAELQYLAAGGPGQADFGLLAPYFAPDVVLHQAAELPYGGVWRGHDGLGEFFLAMAASWAAFDIVDQRFLATDGTAVVLTDVRARARSTGIELAFPILQTIEFDAGRISEIRPFYWDTAAVARACRPAAEVV